MRCFSSKDNSPGIMGRIDIFLPKAFYIGVIQNDINPFRRSGLRIQLHIQFGWKFQ